MVQKIVGYQGVPGSYSSIAAGECFPSAESKGFPTFEDVVRTLQRGEIQYGLLPIENSTSGRVADLHHLLPKSGLAIIGEHFLPIRHCLIGYRGAKKADVRKIYSHREALGQCAQYIRSLKAEPVPYGDTAGAVQYVVEEKRKDIAALASQKAASIHADAVILQKNVQDAADNVTRFLILAKKHNLKLQKRNVITSVVYRTRDVPAALFKSLAGFATTGTNIIKLESFVPMARHTDAHFYLEFEGHPDFFPYSVAVEELQNYTKSFEILGTYPKSPYRRKFNGA
ncbi:MAG TPA: prephenate dehydratase domain-containing protein [Candidatus Paceibacterota bacterium]|nr:prephenate dehydratase domain-containing protein [Candidatus Paceibacterota bacterium]